MLLTTFQAASLTINATKFRFPIYREEIKLVERKAEQRLLAEISKAGFVATYDATLHGFTLSTRRGSVPSFCEAGGWLAMEEARRIFSKS